MLYYLLNCGSLTYLKQASFVLVLVLSVCSSITYHCSPFNVFKHYCYLQLHFFNFKHCCQFTYSIVLPKHKFNLLHHV